MSEGSTMRPLPARLPRLALRMSAGPDVRIVPWVWAACLLLLGGLYWPLAGALWQAWTTDPNYSHGPLVVLAAAALAVFALKSRPRLSDVAQQARATGFTMILAALLLHGVAWVLNFTLLDVVSLVTLLLGMLLVAGGPSMRRRYGFAVLLLLLAAPLPVAWYQPLALAMQKLVSSLAATTLALCGLSVHREGHVIQLTGMSLEVGAACSGMRQLTAYLALGAVLGHLARRGRRFTLTLIALAAVIAVAANLLRIVLSGVLMLIVGPDAAAGVFHTLEGLATLAIGAAGLMAAAVVLARWQDRHSIHHAPRDAAPHAEREGCCAKQRRGWGGLAVLSLLAFAGGVQTYAQRTVDAAPVAHAADLARPLATLPRELGLWQAVDAAPPPDTAWADQYLRRDYRHRHTGQVISVWIAFSPSGADRAHHPEICMDVAGRPEDRSRRAELPLPGGPPIAEFVFGRPGSALASWYWHYALPDGQSAETTTLARLYHRARARRASITVELIAHDDTPAARAAARQLASLVDQALQPLLPHGAVRGSQRLPVGVAARGAI